MSTFHKLMHRLSWYSGDIYSESRGESTWVGFQCSSCGKVEDLHCVDDIINRELKKKPSPQVYL